MCSIKIKVLTNFKAIVVVLKGIFTSGNSNIKHKSDRDQYGILTQNKF